MTKRMTNESINFIFIVDSYALLPSQLLFTFPFQLSISVECHHLDLHKLQPETEPETDALHPVPVPVPVPVYNSTSLVVEDTSSAQFSSPNSPATMADPELQAVENALNTLAVAESEATFQRVVTRLLPPLLSALSTPSAAARAKCIQALHHINLRIRALPNLTLPFRQVLSVACDPSASPLTTNVAIQGGYLAKCFDRFEDRGAVLKDLIEGAGRLEEKNRDVLFYMALTSLQLRASQERAGAGDALWKVLEGVKESSMALFWEYTLLALRGKVESKVTNAMLVAVVRLASEYAGVKQPRRAAAVFAHFLVAASSKRGALAAAGEDALKRVDTCDTLAAEDPSIAETLFALFKDPLSELPLKMIVLSKGLVRITLFASCFPEALIVINHSLLLPGLPNRMLASGMQFFSFVVKHAEEGVVEQYSSDMFLAMKHLIRADVPLYKDVLRGFGYTGLADMIIKYPKLMGAHDVNSEMFFEGAMDKSLPTEVRVSASQALVALTRVIRFGDDEMSDEREQVLETLKTTLQTKSEYANAARVAAVQWANDCFPFFDCDARLLNIIAAGDVKPNVRQLSKAGLLPRRWKRRDGTESGGMDKIAYPDFTRMIDAFSKYDTTFLAPESVAAYLQFMIATIKSQVITKGGPNILTARLFESYFDTNTSVNQSFSKLLEHAHKIVLSSSAASDSALQRAALSVVALGAKIKTFRNAIAQTYVGRFDDLLSSATRKITKGDSDVANGLGFIAGIASECLMDDQLDKLIEKISSGLEPNPNGTPSGRHGEDERISKILILGHIIARTRLRNDIVWDESENTSLSKACLHITRRKMLPVDSSTSVRISACQALADIGASGILPLAVASREKVISSIAGMLKLHSTEAKLVQAGCEALGRICVGEPKSTFRRIASDALLSVCKERKEEEVRFVASENLVRCCTGFDAPLPVNQETQTGNTFSSEEMEAEQLQSILQIKTEGYVIREPIEDEEAKHSSLGDTVAKTITLAYDERPTTRAGGCVSLFTFLRMLGSGEKKEGKSDRKLVFETPADERRYETLQSNLSKLLPDFQQAFTALLADRSDFVQQLASCGVALVYDMSPREMQQDLVSTLVRSLTASRSKAASVVPGDQGTLLELGGVGVKENTAGSRSGTYKELCSLAQDMGQPELVYKFMDLAGHAALWNSRKGAALAGSALLGTELAAEQLRPHVKSLLPRLYVYCHDPTESVRIAMGSVLGAVVKSAGLGSIAEAITKNYVSVTQYCLKSMTSRQWRSREAACGALRDALVSRAWEQVKDDLGEFWYYALRALDDIKESVRKAASGTGRALSELSIHLCNPAQVSVEVASQAVGIVIPAIMPAFTHREPDVRVLATRTLSELIRTGGDALRSSVPELVSSLLEAATELEPQILNYAQFHVDSPDELQDARANAASASASPLIDSLERLAGLVDESIVRDVLPKLTRLARVGVGIPTRAATARFFETLLRTRAPVVEPYAPKLMNSAASAAEMDRNQALRSAWCNAAGNAAKLSPTSDVGFFVNNIVSLASSEEPQKRSLASSLALGIWQRSPDTARKHATAMLPVAYMGRYETDEAAKAASSNWKDVWNEGAPSSEAGLRLYAKEITQICTDRLATSSQYRVKRSAAAALGALAEAANENVDVRYLRQAAKGLLEVLPGHIWEGKVVVVEAIGSLAGSRADIDVWSEAGGTGLVIEKLLEEAQRGKKEYRHAAIESVSKIAERGRSVHDSFNQIRESLSVYWEGLKDEGNGGSSNIARVVWETGSDADAVDARNKARKSQKLLCIASVDCLQCAYPEAKDSVRQERNFPVLLSVIKNIVEGDWEVRLGALQALEKSCSRTKTALLASLGELDGMTVLSHVIELCSLGVNDVKYSVLRRCGLSILMTLGNQSDDAKIIADHLGVTLRKTILSCKQSDSDSGAQGDAKKVCVMFKIR